MKYISAWVPVGPSDKGRIREKLAGIQDGDFNERVGRSSFLICLLPVLVLFRKADNPLLYSINETEAFQLRPRGATRLSPQSSSSGTSCKISEIKGEIRERGPEYLASRDSKMTYCVVIAYHNRVPSASVPTSSSSCVLSQPFVRHFYKSFVLLFFLSLFTHLHAFKLTSSFLVQPANTGTTLRHRNEFLLFPLRRVFHSIMSNYGCIQ